MPQSPGDAPTGSQPAVAANAPAGGDTRPRVSVDVSGLSDRGLRRARNEDHFLVARLDRTWHTLQTNVTGDSLPVTATDTVYGMIVADGMGGHAGGDVASRTAITVFVDMVLRTGNVITRLDEQLTEEALERIVTRFDGIKDALVEAVRVDPSLSGMGTTMTLAASFGADVIVGHVGDSRAYLFRGGDLRRLTRDQTMAQFLRDTGMCSDEELAKHPLRHMLTGVLGTHGTPIDVDVRGLRLQDGDQLLLCSDGLTEMVPETEIRNVLVSEPATAADACRQLVDLALANGGKDNVTVVVGRYRISDR